MSLGADPQMTLRDYFARHNGKEHCLVTNIYKDAIEFYVRPTGMAESDGMHFRLSMKGQLIEVGAWEQTVKEEETAAADAAVSEARDAEIDAANEANK
jgi:hypothetical protein